MIETTVSSCIFKRTDHHAWEKGVMIGEGDAIVDKNFRIVNLVWDYKILHDQGCFLTQLG